MSTCFAADCNHNSYRETCSFFRFPKDADLLMTWTKMCRRADREPNGSNRLCSCHFKDNLKKNGPTVFKYLQVASPEKKTKHRESNPDHEVFIIDDNDCKSEVCDPGPSSIDVIECAEISLEQTAIETESLKLECKSLQTESEGLNSKQNFVSKASMPKMTLGYIQDDAKLLYYYTGLADVSIYALVLLQCTANEFQYYDGWIVEGIDQQDQLLLTLMKLKLNLDYTDLAFRFQICERTVSNVFLTWLHLLHEVLFTAGLSQIMSTCKNQTAMTNSVAPDFTNCKVIVDCMKIRCSVPRKIPNLKGLVGVSPNGVITYVSDLYTGAVSDKEVFDQCGIAEQLRPSDLVLAGKGFLLQDTVPSGESVNITPFLVTGQLTKEEVRAKILVKRAIYRINNFKILSFFPTNFHCFATTIFKVCASLVNLQNPLINTEEKHSQ